MPGSIEGKVPAPRKVMTLFYLVDTSKSMEGKKIQQVNSAIEEVKNVLQGYSDNNDDAELNVAILSFNTTTQWLTPAPQRFDEVENMNLKASGLTALGAAYTALDKKLSRTEFLNSLTGVYPPVIILLSDGAPTDDYISGLNTLKTNAWFKRSLKLAFAIGEAAHTDILSDFTGSMETVIQVNNAAVLREMLVNVSVITSTFQSHPKQDDEKEDVVKDAEKLRKESEEKTKENLTQQSNQQNTTGGAADDIFGKWEF